MKGIDKILDACHEKGIDAEALLTELLKEQIAKEFIKTIHTPDYSEDDLGISFKYDFDESEFEAIHLDKSFNDFYDKEYGI